MDVICYFPASTPRILLKIVIIVDLGLLQTSRELPVIEYISSVGLMHDWQINLK